jgi:hypothetical protein
MSVVVVAELQARIDRVLWSLFRWLGRRSSTLASGPMDGRFFWWHTSLTRRRNKCIKVEVFVVIKLI